MKKKKVILTLACAALLIVATIGTTMALLSDKTEEKRNVFTMAGISGVLREPLFYGDSEKENFVISENRVIVSSNEAEWGVNKAKDFIPGSVIPKDPAVENTSEKVDAYVAVTVEYQLGGEPSTYDEIFGNNGFASVTLDTTNWEWNDDKTVAYYKGGTNGVLAAGQKTATLFDEVIIKTTAKQAETNSIYDDRGNMGVADFDIILNGYLTQSEGVADVETAMKAEFSTIFK